MAHPRSQVRLDSERTPVRNKIKLHVPGYLDDSRRSADAHKTIPVLLSASEDRRIARQDRSEKKPQGTITRIRAVRQPRVHQEQRNPPVVSLPDRIRPDLRFDRGKDARLVMIEKASHGKREVKGKVRNV